MRKENIFILLAMFKKQVGRWVAKLVACLLATAALWVRIQTSLKSTKITEWVTLAEEYRNTLACQKRRRKEFKKILLK